MSVIAPPLVFVPPLLELDGTAFDNPQEGDLLAFDGDGNVSNYTSAGLGLASQAALDSVTAALSSLENEFDALSFTEIMNGGGFVAVDGSGGIALTPAVGQGIALGSAWTVQANSGHLYSPASGALITAGTAYVGGVQSGGNGIESNPASSVNGLKINLAPSQTANGIEQRSGDVVNFSVGPTGNLNLIAGRLKSSLSDTPPVDVVTPAAWMIEYVGAVAYRRPLYL